MWRHDRPFAGAPTTFFDISSTTLESAALYRVMNVTNTNRQPKGQPTGGQFAAKANPEGDTELDPGTAVEVD